MVSLYLPEGLFHRVNNIHLPEGQHGAYHNRYYQHRGCSCHTPLPEPFPGFLTPLVSYGDGQPFRVITPGQGGVLKTLYKPCCVVEPFKFRRILRRPVLVRPLLRIQFIDVFG